MGWLCSGGSRVGSPFKGVALRTWGSDESCPQTELRIGWRQIRGPPLDTFLWRRKVVVGPTSSGGIVEIKNDRMIHLGYGKYWRSDEIAGLLPIEDGRGPGRRTEVYVSTLEQPIVASRSQASILGDMASLPVEEARVAEFGTIAEDIQEALRELSPVLRRMLKSEGRFDVEYWVRRLRYVLEAEDDDGNQEDLFGAG